MHQTALRSLLLLGLAGVATPLAAQGPMASPIDSAAVAQTIRALPWRNIGPANMAGRITDVEGIASPSRTFYVSTAAGGVWKTINGGTTFYPVLDTARVASGGDIAIAPSDTNVIYVGTGEPNSRNSISPGGGVYKSTDGGKSWSFMGLAETRAIARVQVHPTNPDIVWVAALGHVWGPNKERGLYKTVDGGKTWKLTKFIDERTGFVDVQLHPTNPDVLFAASYERSRGPYFLKSGGPGSALWKSTDGGETWTEVKGGGFPETMKGRIGISISVSQPNIMYALVEADTAPNPKPTKGAAAQKRPSGLYRSDDGGATWEYRNPENTRPFYYNQVRVDPTNPDVVFWSSTPVKYSRDGGKTAGNTTVGIHVDHHAMWIDPKDPQRIIVGDDGGVSMTLDGGGTWDFLNTFAIGQFYNISVDMAVPYRVCGGLQDNGSWCGPSRRKQGPITNAMWHNVGGGDGFVTQQDWSDPNILYSTSQGGNMGRYDYAAGSRSALRKPNWRDTYTAWNDSIAEIRGDDSKPETADMRRRIAAIRTQQKRDSIDLQLRWNWNTPYFISKHNPMTLYFGANRVLKSVERGDNMFLISPELSYADSAKLDVALRTTGGITPDVTGAETFGTIVSLNESPMKPGVLYAGTDDGRVWVTQNDGGAWTEVTKNITGHPAGAYVSRLEGSYTEEGTFYVTFDDHRRDDYAPYVYMTTDFGRTFKSIASNLPRGHADFVHVIREDPTNPNLLYVGTDVGVYVSLNRGGSWQRFMTGLPTTPVHDLVVHPRDHELVAGTHGRSIWIADVAPLQQLSADVMAQSAYLFAPRTAYQWGEPPINGGNPGHKVFEAPSPQYGADLWYRVGQGTGQARLVVQDASGDTLTTLTGPGGPGVHRVSWNMRGKPAPVPPLSPAQLRDSITQARRTEAALDSLEKAGALTAAQVAQARQMMSGGAAGIQRMFGGGGGRGGFGGAGGARNDRPGETRATPSFPTAAAAAPGGPGGRGGRGGAGGPPDPAGMQEIFSVLRDALGQDFNPFGGGRGGRGGRGGGQAGMASSGDYKVTLTAGGRTVSQVLRVEQLAGAGDGGFGFGGDDEDDLSDLAAWFDQWMRSRK
jgi:photosystem II stability/assembly factor-like uncharacterized protein